eukprot:CAMPEP_0180407900 /NCGR_PEP_ID=MMETSP0989-20121125/41976_2 /TAXON_ID=697907 /ORGANISM="non described non described, Strain CCMP2293" /LENGTH=49 /DNA_ID= /DNA_START= /DNA_END= /DNA_ORIENTATION=
MPVPERLVECERQAALVRLGTLQNPGALRLQRASSELAQPLREIAHGKA